MHDYIVVDAFARKPLTGNPVAVFFDCADLDTQRMQAIAQELHLSECTFVLPPESGGDHRIRIFTPVNELPFAGHPLLGTVVALHEVFGGAGFALETAQGLVRTTIDVDGGAAQVWMRQPIPGWERYERSAELLAALGAEGSITPVEAYRNGPRHVFVGFDSVAALSALRPDHKALSLLPDMAANCFAGAGLDWRARMFSPAYGVVEDAATGSAAGPLAIHLARHGLAEFGREIRIRQGVEMGRQALMRARASLADDASGALRSVEVGGHGVIVARGTIFV
jgi:trans-2,3-dihydro-3-hydroxyanthranilate isomerase